MTKVIVDGKKYVSIDEIETKLQPAKVLKGMKYVIVRTCSAGVFAGYLKSRKGQEVSLVSARRLWYWNGAASL